MERHFNVTVYVINEEGKFLFIRHKKLQKWLPPGGHIEPNEKPDVAALREVKEETGLDIELDGERFPRETDCVRPYGIQLNVIKEGEHEHMDLIYRSKPVENTNLILNEEETEGINWYSLEEILDPEFDSFKETKQWCKKLSLQLETPKKKLIP